MFVASMSILTWYTDDGLYLVCCGSCTHVFSHISGDFSLDLSYGLPLSGLHLFVILSFDSCFMMFFRLNLNVFDVTSVLI